MEDDDSYSFKREKSPLGVDQNPPQKKIKIDDEDQIDINKIVAEGL